MTIAAVAQAAKVPYATAWRIINNQPCRSQESIDKVRLAMSQLGYNLTPARPAQRRTRKSAGSEGIRTRNVALLNLRGATSISSSVLSIVQAMLAERGLNLIFAQVDSPDSLPQAVRAGKVDGILGYGLFPPEAINPKLLQTPAVWMMSRFDLEEDTWGDRVQPDHTAIGRLAAKHLLAKGHLRLGYMNPEQGVAVFQHRLDSFRSAAEQIGRTVDVLSVRGSHDIDTQAQQLVDLWINSPHRPTGLFVPVDRVTLRVHHHLLRRGIQPGRDVELVSCDHEPELLALMGPTPPASIDLHRQTIAKIAVERLFWRMRHGLESPRIVVAVRPTLNDAADNADETASDTSDLAPSSPPPKRWGHPVPSLAT